MFDSTGLGAPGKVFVMFFMTYAYWAAIGGPWVFGGVRSWRADRRCSGEGQAGAERADGGAQNPDSSNTSDGGSSMDCPTGGSNCPKAALAARLSGFGEGARRLMGRRADRSCRDPCRPGRCRKMI